MPFKEIVQPNIGFWKPEPKNFDQATDRLYVELNWSDDSLILAWSSDGDEAGGLVLAPEAIPGNLFRGLLDVTDALSIEHGLFVTQSAETNHLIIELAHPKYRAKFVTMGGVCKVRQLRELTDHYSDELAGHWRVKPGLRNRCDV